MRETLGFHPLANIFPLIEGQAFTDLVEDIRAHGVRHAVIVFDGLILDGRNRYRAAEAADVDHVPLTTFSGTYHEALALVISENFHRRHLTDGQRQFCAAKIATLTPGRPSEETPPIGGISVPDAARLMNVAPRGVERAKQVQRDARPELVAAAERGLIAVDLAAQASKLSAEVQAEVVREAESGKLKNLRTILKRAARTAKEKELGAKQRALPDKKFGVIVADPEWRFEPYSRDTGMDRAPENHYPTSVTQEIAERSVADIAAADCVLFLWATAPMLPDALKVMEAWGFRYKTHVIWRKDKPGMGYWFRNLHELLLVGTKGEVPAPAPGTQLLSVIDAPVGAHSSKPDGFMEWIEGEFPNVPKIELNARTARPNWDAWGLEAPEPVDAEWRSVPGFDGYEASSSGQIRSTRSRHGDVEPHIVKPWVEKAGYLRVGLRVDGETKNAWAHRLVAAAFLGDVADREVDHIDGNRGNNASSNVRLTDREGNARNTSAKQGSSAFKGVSWDKARKRWFASIMVDGQTLALGRFESERSAAEAYDVAATLHFGEFARLNFASAADEGEALYTRATEVIRNHNGAGSTSFLQRQLQIGYNAAARLIERMERDGIVTEPDHRGRRSVIKPESNQETNSHDDSDREEERATGEQGSSGQRHHEDQRGLHIHACERVEQEGDRDPAAGGDEALAEGHHDGARRAAAVEGVVLPLRDGPEPIGLFVGGKGGGRFVPTAHDPSPPDQYVEKHVPPPPRAPDAPEKIEIPAFLIRKRDPEASD